MIFSTCNFIFVRKNQIATENSDGPDPLKKAMTKVMIVYGVQEICGLFLIAIIFATFRDNDSVSSIIRYALYYTLELSMPLLMILLVPISIAIFLKPVNDRLKQMFRLCPLHSYCKVCKRDEE